MRVHLKKILVTFIALSNYLTWLFFHCNALLYDSQRFVTSVCLCYFSGYLFPTLNLKILWRHLANPDLDSWMCLFLADRYSQLPKTCLRRSCTLLLTNHAYFMRSQILITSARSFLYVLSKYLFSVHSPPSRFHPLISHLVIGGLTLAVH